MLEHFDDFVESVVEREFLIEGRAAEVRAKFLIIFGAPRDCTNWQPETRLKQLGAESDHFNVSPTPLHEESFDSVFLSLAALGTMRGKPPLFQPSLASQNFPLNLEFGEPKLSHHPPLQGYKYQRDLRSLSDFL